MNTACPALIEGEGAAIYRVDFVDLNGQGPKETVVSWQLGAGLYQLGVYTMDGLAREEEDGAAAAQDPEKMTATQLLLTAYSRYALLDIDRDTRTEVALCRLDPGGGPSALEIYGWNDGVLSCRDMAELSARASSIDSMQANYVGGELLTPALYVCSSLAEGGRAVDIVAYQGDRLVDLTMDPESGVSREISCGERPAGAGRHQRRLRAGGAPVYPPALGGGRSHRLLADPVGAVRTGRAAHRCGHHLS